MKTVLLLLTFYCGSSLFAQSNTPDLLTKLPDWKTEIIAFPFGFAPSIPYKGYEDLRFAPHWSDSTHTQFWTYAIAWSIDEKKPVSKKDLSTHVKAYYDGLMGVTAPNPANTKPATVLKLKRKGNQFRGTMHVYDNFFTHKVITLYLEIEQYYCTELNRRIVQFRISKQDFEHVFWKTLRTVKVETAC